MTPWSLATASNALGLDLYGRLRAEQPGNLVFSPASIAVALAMTRAGARGGTAKEMDRVLSVEDEAATHRAASELLRAWNVPDRRDYELCVVNRLFGERSFTFEPSFLALTGEQYGAPLEALDFRGNPDGSRVRINGWVADQTRSRIRDLLPAGGVRPDTRLVLVNAVYFLGRWSEPFRPAATRPEMFHAEGRREVRVPMMRQTAWFRHAVAPGLQLLEMAYTGGELAMVVILPDARDGLDKLERQLGKGELDAWLGTLAYAEVAVTLPRFRVEPAAAARLEDLLGEMGMPTAFTPHADFSAMASPPDPRDRLALAAVYHKAFVQVDESGTEAAAATAPAAIAGGAPAFTPPPHQFRADHPFMFLLRDLRSGIILFLGRIVDPA